MHRRDHVEICEARTISTQASTGIKRWLIEDGDEDDDGKVRERAPFN
jgi:hypothetical protein